MGKPSPNQLAAVDALKSALNASTPPADYADATAWKKAAPEGTVVTAKSLVNAALVEEINVAFGSQGKVKKFYRPKA